MRPIEYENYKALSQSALKMLALSPSIFYETEERWLSDPLAERNIEKVKTKAMELGSVVDCLLLTPEDFEKSYEINKTPPITGQLLSFTEYLISVSKRDGILFEIENNPEVFEEAYKFVDFKREGLESVLSNFSKKAKEYYIYKFHQNSDKYIITEEVFEQAKKLKEEAFSHKFIREVLDNSYEKITQLPLYSEINKIKVKGLIDLIVINHKEKIIKPYDLKTSSDKSFSNSYYKYRYDIQQNLYTILILEWAAKNYPSYSILPMVFIVLNTKDNYRHGLWSIGSNNSYLFNSPIEEFNVNGYTYKGLLSLLNDYIWHRTLGKWDFSREVYESGGFNLIRFSDETEI